MAHADTTFRTHIPSDDELDDILNGIVDGQDAFDTSEKPQADKGKKAGGKDDTLGLDEEIKVVKKRQPIPKLDEGLLLSSTGIPKLRRISKDRLKFKGKGHEYGDIARMLNMYQLWLDDMYPRAKFGDALTMIEKCGHSKRLQVMRKEWIDEGKPRHTTEPDHDDSPTAEEEKIEQNTVQMEDLDIQERQAEQPVKPSVEHEPDDDELDMLLAQEEPTSMVTSTTQPVPTDDDPFADDMEAMAEMEGMW